MAAVDEGPIGHRTRGMLKRSAAAAGLATRPANAVVQPPAKLQRLRAAPAASRLLQLQPPPIVRPKNGPISDECELLTQDYVQDINDYQFDRETHFILPRSFLDDEKIQTRAILVDWVVKVHLKLSLEPDTLPLTVYIIDRYLERGAEVEEEGLQLMAVSAILAAAKYEEVFCPEVEELQRFVPGGGEEEAEEGRAAMVKEMLRMEVALVKATGFDLGRPHPKHFLFHFWTKEGGEDAAVYALALYLAELCLLDASFSSIKSSLISAGSLWLSSHIKGSALNEKKAFASVADEAFTANAKNTGQRIASLALNVRRETNLKAVTEKYAAPKMHQASQLNEAEERLLEQMAASE